MRVIPIPNGLPEAMNGQRVVIGPEDPTREDLRACEYVVIPSTLTPGALTFCALVELDDEDRAALAGGGALLMLQMDGAEVPWSLDVVARWVG